MYIWSYKNFFFKKRRQDMGQNFGYELWCLVFALHRKNIIRVNLESLFIYNRRVRWDSPHPTQPFARNFYTPAISSLSYNSCQPVRVKAKHVLPLRQHQPSSASILFCIRELADAHNWLVSVWLTGERIMPPLAPRQHGQFSFIGSWPWRQPATDLPTPWSVSLSFSSVSYKREIF